jgi:hypothetical protein
MTSLPLYPVTVMPPFISETCTLAGRDGSLSGMVACSGSWALAIKPAARRIAHELIVIRMIIVLD